MSRNITVTKDDFSVGLDVSQETVLYVARVLNQAQTNELLDPKTGKPLPGKEELSNELSILVNGPFKEAR